MKQNKTNLFILSAMAISTSLLVLIACSKGGNTPTTPPTSTADACAGKTITITGAATASDPCGSGKVTITVSGSTGFSFSIDGGTFQTSNDFSNLIAGDHTITAKDNAGCLQSTKVTVPTAAAGLLFTAVKNLMVANCISCHSGSNPTGGKDFTSDCIIVSNKNLILSRAVDGIPSFMPAGGKLGAADMKKISDWVNAGGRYTD